MTARTRIGTFFVILLTLTFQPVAFASNPLNHGLDPDKEMVRAFFPSLDLARKVVRSMDAIESSYDAGYLVLQVGQEEVDLLTQLNFTLEYLTGDEISALFENTAQPSLKSAPDGAASLSFFSGINGYSCYRTVEETFETAENITLNYPDLATWIDAGNSWEKTAGMGGYDMKVLKLTNGNITGEKPILFITSAIHAREYATAELVTRFAEYLVENYGIHPDITWILDYHEVHLMLHSNPDGRKKAEQGILWRKNTNQNYCSATSNSRGVDLNRNFPFKWNCCGGGSNSQCEEDYRGPAAGSEPETSAIVSYLKSIFPDRRGPGDNDAAPTDTSGVYLDIHSHGKLVLWPWGEKDVLSPNNSQFQTLGRKLAFFNGYTPERAYGLYPTDGTTDGMGYGELGVASYCIELGTAFFEKCDYFTGTIVPENLPVLMYAAKVARSPYITPAGPDVINLSVGQGGSQVPVGTFVTLSATAIDTQFNNSNGTEPTQNIAEGEYYIDTPPWVNGATAIPLGASDGSFNSKSEVMKASVDTNSLSSGKHTLFVRAKDASGIWGAVSAVFLNLTDASANQPPVSKFSYSVSDLMVNFTDQSSDADGGVVSWNWEFGDGTSSGQKNPSHLYSSAGTYSVKLMVSDSDGASHGSTQNLSVGTTVNYCSGSGKDNSYEWIAKVTVGGFSNPSQKEVSGYGNFTSKNVNMVKGVSQGVTLTPGFSSSSYSEAWRVWIDLNRNGNFDDTGELLFEKTGTTAVTGSIMIPASTAEGKTRMRISMRYKNLPSSCGEMDYGEVEDYTVTVEGNGNANQPPKASFSHSVNGLTVSFRDQSSDPDGSISSWRWDFADASGSSEQHPVHTFGASGTYTVQLTVTDNSGASESHSASVQVTQPPTSVSYCSVKGSDVSYEWIAGVAIGSFSNPSAGNGYGDFTSKTIGIPRGSSQSVTLTPGFAGTAYNEYFRIWIDLNRDGDFSDTGEKVFEKYGSSRVTGSFSLPTSSLVGKTRMRVSMQYGKYATECQSFQYGEVEDYTVNIQ